MRVSAGLAVSLFLAVAAPAVAAPPRDDIRIERPDASDPDGVGITFSRPDSPRMLAAHRQAREGLPAFMARLADPAADESAFMVKFDLAGSREFIWADELRLENGRLTGRLANTPLHADFSYGQRVVIAQAAIVDWGFYRGRVMQGQYSTRVQLEVMAPEQARQVREAFGW